LDRFQDVPQQRHRYGQPERRRSEQRDQKRPLEGARSLARGRCDCRHDEARNQQRGGEARQQPHAHRDPRCPAELFPAERSRGTFATGAPAVLASCVPDHSTVHDHEQSPENDKHAQLHIQMTTPHPEQHDHGDKRRHGETSHRRGRQSTR
jgi:hypothetical protein